MNSSRGAGPLEALNVALVSRGGRCSCRTLRGASARHVSGCSAWLAGDGVEHALGAPAARGGHEAARHAGRVSALAPHVQRRPALPPGVARTCAARSDLRAGLDRRVRTGAVRCDPLDRCPGEHRRWCRCSRRRARCRHRRGAYESCPARIPASRGSPPPRRGAWGSVLVSDARARPGRRNDACRRSQDFLYESCLVDWEASTSASHATPTSSTRPRRYGSWAKAPT